MRALSVKQPWAELIALGKKKIEFRTWQRDFRGDLLIVASKSRQDDECEEEDLDPAQLAYGAAVCIVDFWKVTGSDGDYEWHLRDPRRVEAFPVTGYASIYNVDDVLIREVPEPQGSRSAAATKGVKATKSVEAPVKKAPKKPEACSEASAKRGTDPLARWRPALEKSGLITTPQPRPKKKPTFIR